MRLVLAANRVLKTELTLAAGTATSSLLLALEAMGVSSHPKYKAVRRQILMLTAFAGESVDDFVPTAQEVDHMRMLAAARKRCQRRANTQIRHLIEAAKAHQ